MNEEIKKVRDDVIKVIQNSKATFFVTERSQIKKIPPKEIIYELKAEIMTNVEMYFINLMNKKQ